MEEINILKIRFEKLYSLGQKWEKIFEITEIPLPFISYGWFFCLGKYLLKREIEVMVFYKGEEVVGILPAELKSDNLYLIGDERVTDLNGLLSKPDYTEEIIDTLANFIIDQDLNIELSPLTKESKVLQFLPDKLDSKRLDKLETMPVLNMLSSWSKYLSSLSSKKRHELRRKIKKAEGAELRELRAKDIFKLFELMESSSSDKRIFLEEEMKNFFSSLALYFEKIGALRLKGAFYNNEIMGILFCFQMNDSVYAFNTGYNPDFGELSPGVVSFALDIKAGIDEGFTYYNFLRGEERFKFDLGARRFYTWKIKRLKSA